jgi:hypothetical protein
MRDIARKYSEILIEKRDRKREIERESEREKG